MAHPEREEPVTRSTDDPERTTTHPPPTTETFNSRTIDYQPNAPIAPVAIPGYDLLGELGRGGMGVVYRAEHRHLKRIVALKMVLGGAQAGDRERARFRIEAEAVARLQHPNIVQIHEVGEVNGHPYCALEFVEGGSLATKLLGQPMDARAAARLVEQLAGAMQLAHSRNVVHRDLKPANVLLASDGTPKITDFGLARHLDRDSGETHAGAVMGTPSYMAPEQASGLTHDAGPAADVYALGAILYECLTGRPPFRGKSVVETLDQVRHQEPVLPSKLVPNVPRDLETICLKCLRKEPEKRYASAQELADDLARYRGYQPITARPVGVTERVRLWWRRNPGLGILAVSFATLFVLVAVAAIVAAVQFSQLAGQRQQALNDVETANKSLAATNTQLETERNNVASALQERTAALGKAKRALAISTEAEALTAWQNRNPSMALARLQTIDPDARFWEWGFIAQRFSPTTYLSDEQTSIGHVAWAPDGRTLAVTTGKGHVLLVEAKTGKVQRRIDTQQEVSIGVHLTEDGSSVVYACAKEVQVWSLSGERLRRWKPEHDFTAFAASPIGHRIACGTADGTVRVWDAQTGKEEPPIPKHAKPERVVALAFDSSGRTLARAMYNDIVSVVPLAGGPVVDFQGSRGLIALAFSPDGFRLAGGGSESIMLWDLSKKALERELPLYASKPDGYQFTVTGIDFRGDGQQLATCCGNFAFTKFPGPSPDNSVRIWDPNSGRQLHAMHSPLGPVYQVRYRPDGQQLVATAMSMTAPHERGLHLWDRRGDGDYRRLSGSAARVSALAFNTTGAQIASVSGAAQLGGNLGSFEVWDVATGRTRFSMAHRDMLDHVAWSPNDQVIALATRSGGIETFDARTYKPLHVHAKAHPAGITALHYLADGRLLSAGRDGMVRLWDKSHQQPVAELQRPIRALEVAPLAVPHPEGAIVVGALLPFGDSEEEIVIWYPHETKAPVVLDRVRGGTIALAITRAGDQVAALNNRGEIILWDWATRKRRAEFKAHVVTGTSLAFSVDGRRLASMGGDRQLHVWDVETQLEIIVLEGPKFPGDSLRFSPDGQRLAAGGGGSSELNPYGGDLFVWESVPAPPSHERDAAWHTNILLQDRLHGAAACFHGLYASEGPMNAGAARMLLYDYFDTLNDEARQGDPRLPNLQKQYAIVFDRLAVQLVDDDHARMIVLSHYLATRWQYTLPRTYESANGAKIALSPRPSITSTGPNPDHDTYTLTFDAGKTPVTGVKLHLHRETQTRHLGRSANGNFNLSELELYALETDPQKPIRIPLGRAWASYNATAQEHYSKQDMRPEFALDGDPKTGWNSWPKITSDQVFIAEANVPTTLKPQQWQVRLRFEGTHLKHTLHDFGVSFTTSSHPLMRGEWQVELANRPLTWWTIQALGAWFDNTPQRALTALAKVPLLRETPLDLAVRAWAFQQTKSPMAAAARQQAEQAATAHPNDRVLKRLLESP